jgi:alkylhydroperoxidase family enzyme
MTWIRVIPFDRDEKLRLAREALQSIYPIEYAEPTHPHHAQTEGIVASHSLIPDALHHAFAAFGALMSPELPLSRRQHEMITTVVSAINRCQY